MIRALVRERRWNRSRAGVTGCGRAVVAVPRTATVPGFAQGLSARRWFGVFVERALTVAPPARRGSGSWIRTHSHGVERKKLELRLASTTVAAHDTRNRLSVFPWQWFSLSLLRMSGLLRPSGGRCGLLRSRPIQGDTVVFGYAGDLSSPSRPKAASAPGLTSDGKKLRAVAALLADGKRPSPSPRNTTAKTEVLVCPPDGGGPRR